MYIHLTVMQLYYTIYETGDWPKDFTEITMIALKKKTQATKCSDHRTISLIANTAKIIPKIFRRRIERKVEAVLGEDQFGFRRGKGTRVAIGMMGIIAEQTLEIDKELCICFVDWQKADRVNWTKLVQILKISCDKLDKDAVCHQFCSTSTANFLPGKLWMGLET